MWLKEPATRKTVSRSQLQGVRGLLEDIWPTLGSERANIYAMVAVRMCCSAIFYMQSMALLSSLVTDRYDIGKAMRRVFFLMRLLFVTAKRYPITHGKTHCIV